MMFRISKKLNIPMIRCFLNVTVYSIYMVTYKAINFTILNKFF